MFRSVGTTLLTGLFTILPIVLTIYLLYWGAVTSEQVFGTALRQVLPEVAYFPGLGSLAGLFGVFLVGLLMKAVLIRQIFNFSENILYRLPIIKTLYGAIRDLFEFFSPKKENFGRVVIVRVGHLEAIGFVTQEDPERMPESFRGRDSVLVYLPMSYMIGGFTLLVPRDQIEPCDMSMDAAMRFTLTAGITGQGGNIGAERNKPL